MRRRAMMTCLAATFLSGCASPRAASTDPTTLGKRVVPCPCDMGRLWAMADYRPGLVVSRDCDATARQFHPGATHVYRLYDPAVDQVAGNQCSYDEGGRLIRSGPAAGTPDLCSPEYSLTRHVKLDVMPFLKLGWAKYHRKGWAPVSEPELEPSP